MAKYRKSPHGQHQNTHPNLLVYPHNNWEHQLLAALEIWVLQTTVIIFSTLPHNTTQWPGLAHTNTSLISLEFPCENNERLERRSAAVWAADGSWQAGLYQFTAQVHRVRADPTAVWELENCCIFLPKCLHVGTQCMWQHKVSVYLLLEHSWDLQKNVDSTNAAEIHEHSFTCHTGFLFQNSV